MKLRLTALWTGFWSWLQFLIALIKSRYKLALKSNRLSNISTFRIQYACVIYLEFIILEERYHAALNYGAERKEIMNEELICKNLNVIFLVFTFIYNF
jgi:hypothetical protein